MPETAHFSVATRLATLLSETYRSTEAALKELADNSWDADSDNVWITLPKPLTEEPIIVRGDVRTNTVEGYSSLFKRGMRGVYQRSAQKSIYTAISRSSTSGIMHALLRA